jgi:hypothetical protein
VLQDQLVLLDQQVQKAQCLDQLVQQVLKVYLVLQDRQVQQVRKVFLELQQRKEKLDQQVRKVLLVQQVPLVRQDQLVHLDHKVFFM